MGIHWCSRWIGIPYSTLNCAELVADVLEKEFLRQDIADTLRGYPEHHMGTREQSNAIARGCSQLTDRTEDPQDGDGVILKIGSRLSHMGLVVNTPKGLYILHTVAERGSVVEPVGKLLTCTVEGYYRWK
jgi:hypothetical protein